MPEENRTSAHKVAVRAARHSNAEGGKVQIPNIPDSFFPITSREDFQRKAAALLGEHQQLTVAWTVTRQHPTSEFPPHSPRG